MLLNNLKTMDEETKVDEVEETPAEEVEAASTEETA